jgi:hypothetical protein
VAVESASTAEHHTAVAGTSVAAVVHTLAVAAAAHTVAAAAVAHSVAAAVARTVAAAAVVPDSNFLMGQADLSSMKRTVTFLHTHIRFTLNMGRKTVDMRESHGLMDMFRATTSAWY